jgi:hypothetical protein
MDRLIPKVRFGSWIFRSMAYIRSFDFAHRKFKVLVRL